jgi:SNF2 family DNA or RNA helicase
MQTQTLIPPQFPVGTRVRVVGAPERQGTVSGNSTGTKVRVEFDNGRTTLMDPEYLEPVPVSVDALSELAAGLFQGPVSLRRNLLHQKLDGRLQEVLYSMDASNTTFYAYQFKPVIKLLESPTNSILIADEVGLGKTIEAGLIWTELTAREGAGHLLVVCPPHLVTKWKQELKRRFGVDATVAKADTVLEKFEDAQRGQSGGFALIATYNALRPPTGYDRDLSNTSPKARLARKLDEWGTAEEPFLDLLIMDEAAIMRNDSSQTSTLGSLITPVAKHKVYLSATPLHTSSDNLFTLLHRLDPDQFQDMATFRAILEANTPLVLLREELLRPTPSREAIDAHLLTASQSPILANSQVLAEIRTRIENTADLTDRRVCIELAYQTERANLLSYQVTRTRRRDVDTNPVIREVNTIRVELTATETALYQQVTEAIQQYAFTKGISDGFLTVMPQRQVASCMAAAYARFSGQTEADLDEVNPDMAYSTPVRPSGPLVDFVRGRLAGAFDLQELRNEDSKYTNLLRALKEHWTQHPGSKVILFAYFKPTLRYLSERLAEDGIPSLLLTGDETGDKQKVVDAFANSKQANILLSSEVGSEGLDLQFASTVINYDLPWNPMVVEQRIGRIHRIGQKAARILVINFVCANTVDQRIYDRLYDRLDLFRRTIGDLEAVIGNLITGLSRELLSLHLNEEEQLRKIDQIATAAEQNIALEEQLEGNASILSAYGDYVINRIASAHKRGDWIKGEDLEEYVVSFFARVFPKTRVQGIDPKERIYEIEFDPEAWHTFEEFLKNNGLRGQTQLKSDQRGHIKFDHQVFKSTSKHTELINQAHPVIRFINHHLRSRRIIQQVAIAAEVSPAHRPADVTPGLYGFISQRWSVEGLGSYEKLQHQVVHLETGEAVTEPVQAAAIVEAAAGHGTSMDGVDKDDGDFLANLSSVMEELTEAADSAFGEFEAEKRRENEDRKQIQLVGVNSFEERRTRSLLEIITRQIDAGNVSLVAANRGQIEKLRRKSAAQRQKIESKTVTGSVETIAAGIIRIH